MVDSYYFSRAQFRVSLIIRELFVSLNCQLTLVIIRSLFRRITGGDQFNSEMDDSDFVKLGTISRGRYEIISRTWHEQEIYSTYFSPLQRLYLFSRETNLRVRNSTELPNEKDRRINSSTTDVLKISAVPCLFINIYKKKTIKISHVSVRSGKISARLKSFYIFERGGSIHSAWRS